jgi:transcription elongation GreA/GreB family factor
MTIPQNIVFKTQLKEHCRQLIQNRMDSLRIAMNQSQESANEETKSSAGDKYETSRAMGQLEKDMYARQLAETGKEMASLMSIDCSMMYNVVSPGSIVRCDKISYFILAGIGKTEFNGSLIYVISPNAPLAKSLLGKRKDDIVTINNGIQQIKEIF